MKHCGSVKTPRCYRAIILATSKNELKRCHCLLADVLRRCIRASPQAVVQIEVGFVPDFDGVKSDTGVFYLSR